MLKLSNRLQMVAELVREGMPLADIGTDHAYLPTYLLLNNLIPSAYACDLRDGPLQNARETIKKYGVADSVVLCISDGLRALNKGDVHDFVIAGMGGNLIADILAASPWVLENGNHFVLQPQSHPEDLREYLVNTGFKILKESVTREGRHLYHALEVVYTGEIIDTPIYYYYLGELPSSNSEYRDEYIKFIYDRLQFRLSALEQAGVESGTCEMLKTVISNIENFMKGELTK